MVVLRVCGFGLQTTTAIRRAGARLAWEARPAKKTADDQFRQFEERIATFVSAAQQKTIRHRRRRPGARCRPSRSWCAGGAHRRAAEAATQEGTPRRQPQTPLDTQSRAQSEQQTADLNERPNALQNSLKDEVTKVATEIGATQEATTQQAAQAFDSLARKIDAPKPAGPKPAATSAIFEHFWEF